MPSAKFACQFAAQNQPNERRIRTYSDPSSNQQDP